MEIITFVVDGFLTHKDSMGTKETIPKGMLLLSLVEILLSF
jgi:redox-sensitive bicupin YhaK (pirin superfamily)